MPTISLTLKTQEAEANLQATDISEANAEHIIRGVFSVFSPAMAAAVQVTPAVPEPHVVPVPQQAEAPAEIEDQAKLMAEEEIPQEHWVTGIKYKRINGEDIPHYRTRYKCPNPKCKKVSKHYIREGAAYTECHNCSTQIAVKKATMRGIPDRDQQGNFYVAEGYYYPKA